MFDAFDLFDVFDVFEVFDVFYIFNGKINITDAEILNALFSGCKAYFRTLAQVILVKPKANFENDANRSILNL